MAPNPRTRTVSPLELFYDLVVVVLVGQAAHLLAVVLAQSDEVPITLTVST